MNETLKNFLEHNNCQYVERAENKIVVFDFPCDEILIAKEHMQPNTRRVRALANCISETGRIEPILVSVKNDNFGLYFLVIDGLHRLLAARLLSLRTIPCILRPNINFISKESKEN